MSNVLYVILRGKVYCYVVMFICVCYLIKCIIKRPLSLMPCVFLGIANEGLNLWNLKSNENHYVKCSKFQTILEFQTLNGMILFWYHANISSYSARIGGEGEIR